MIVYLCLYETVNDSLLADKRNRRLPCGFQSVEATTGELLDDVGVPRTMVELVAVDGKPVDSSHRLQEGARPAEEG